MQGLVAGPSIMAAARGFAIDRHEIELVRPAFGDPRRKAGLEQVSVDPIHHRAQPIGTGNSVVELGKATQERQMRLSSINDVFIVIAAGDRSAHHQEQNLAQRVGDFSGLPCIIDLRKVIE